jgi:hypothetical protein
MGLHLGLLLPLGLLGSVLPLLPGTLLILVGALVYARETDFVTLAASRLLILTALTATAYAVDYVAGAIGVFPLSVPSTLDAWYERSMGHECKSLVSRIYLPVRGERRNSTCTMKAPKRALEMDPLRKR